MKYLFFVYISLFFFSAQAKASGLCVVNENQTVSYSSSSNRGGFQIDEKKHLFAGEYIACRREGGKVFIKSSYSESGGTINTEIELPPSASQQLSEVKKAPTSYMDGKKGSIVSVYKEPGIDWKQNKVYKMLGEDKGVAWVPVGKPGYEVEVVDAVMVEDYRDPTLVPDELSADEITLQNQLFYKVKVKYPGETRIREGWVHADFIRYSEMSHEHHDCEKVHPMPKGQSSNVSETKKAIDNYVETTQANLANELATNWTGQCLKSHYALNWKELPRDTPKRIQDAYLKEIQKTPLPSHNGKPLSHKTLLAIDSLARTLYGEMRSCYRKGDGYFKAVARSAVNRAEFDTHNKNPRYAPKSVKGQTVEEIMPKLFQKDWAYTAWHPTDSNIRGIICPAKKTKRQKELWESAVRVAMDSILDDGEALKSSTPNFPYRYYTSGIPNSNKGAQEINHVVVDGVTLDSKRCLRVWKL